MQRITVNQKIQQNQGIPTILEYCRSNGIPLLNTPCGGKGTCGKCKVMVEKPYNREVLACQTKVSEGMEFVISGDDDEMVVLDTPTQVTNREEVSSLSILRKNSLTLAACDIGTTTVVCYLLDGDTGAILSTRSGANPQRSFGADVLSRIEAACVSDSTISDSNTKNENDADIITTSINNTNINNSNINNGSKNNLEIMQSRIVKLIDDWIADMLTECNRKQVSVLSVAGNTVMCYLLMGMSPEKLGRAPFLPDEYFGKSFDAAKIGFENCQTMIIFPAVSGFVGGDITAGMMKTVNSDELTLFLDIGTNGEMALGKDGRYVCCATAAGPAFEGAEIEFGMPAARGAVDKVWLEGRRIKYTVIGNDRPTGICGSGLIDALAVLLKAGIIDENGTIQSGAELSILYRSYVFEVELPQTSQIQMGMQSVDMLQTVNTGHTNIEDSNQHEDAYQLAVHIAPGVYITQEDIRKLQLAKGAIAAGIEVLFKEYGCKPQDLDILTFAGGFGNYINKESAAAIGLFPKELLDRTREVGNAAGDGAIAAVLSKEAWNRALELSGNMQYIELASYPGFEELYVENMNFK